MVEAIAFGVFIFVAIVVAGWRAIDESNRRKARSEAERLSRVSRRARPGYSGPRFNRWGREVD